MPSDSIRYASAESFLKAIQLDSGELGEDAKKAINYISATLYNDAALAIDQSQFEKANRYFGMYMANQEAIKLNLDVLPERKRQFKMFVAFKMANQLDSIYPYDTTLAKEIMDIYREVLDAEPENQVAYKSLMEVESTDGIRRQEFFNDLQKENELNKAESDRRRTQTIALGGGLAMVLVLAGLSFRAYRQKRKDNAIIEAQKARGRRSARAAHRKEPGNPGLD